MALARHSKANREFFAPGSCPTIHQWKDWLERGVVRGKVIDGKPFIDINHFAVNDILAEPSRIQARVTGRDLLAPRLVG